MTIKSLAFEIRRALTYDLSEVFDTETIQGEILERAIEIGIRQIPDMEVIWMYNGNVLGVGELEPIIDECISLGDFITTCECIARGGRTDEDDNPPVEIDPNNPEIFSSTKGEC